MYPITSFGLWFFDNRIDLLVMVIRYYGLSQYKSNVYVVGRG